MTDLVRFFQFVPLKSLKEDRSPCTKTWSLGDLRPNPRSSRDREGKSTPAGDVNPVPPSDLARRLAERGLGCGSAWVNLLRSGKASSEVQAMRLLCQLHRV